METKQKLLRFGRQGHPFNYIYKVNCGIGATRLLTNVCAPEFSFLKSLLLLGLFKNYSLEQGAIHGMILHTASTSDFTFCCVIPRMCKQTDIFLVSANLFSYNIMELKLSVVQVQTRDCGFF
jgi:hypothetical protein